ncbi:hypothetical protein M8J77_013518 [Diaphorina citri]|nr:hypothetical protein M8J77_004802 [Diaphorina citri]KAI5714804.1 hypothetical protein M8J77_005798 [Diaphorina citri]KAI5715274.1 hypothetical protein M8J77_013518 [Diaphorina citri]
MTDTTVEVPTTCNTIDSNQARSNAQSVDIHKYVTQLEKRVLEQEQLIALLNDKISGLESRSGKKSYYQALVNQDNPTTSSGSSGSHATVQSADGVVASGSSSADGNGQRIKSRSTPSVSFIGSRKTDIASVPTVRYFQLFVTRVNPATSCQLLTENLMNNIPELSSVKCSKLKTRHASYASFHVVVPEAEKSLVFCGDAWPEGTLVKQFAGKLLRGFVQESFSSGAAGGDSASVGSGSAGNGADVTRPKTTGAPPKRKVQPKSTTTVRQGGVATGSRSSSPLVTGGTSNTSPAPSTSASSPKNSRPKRVLKKS